MLKIKPEQILLDKKIIQSALEKNDLKALYDANHKMLGGLLYCENVSGLISASQLLQSQFNIENPDMQKIISAAEVLLNEMKLFTSSASTKNDTQQAHSSASPDALHSKT